MTYCLSINRRWLNGCIGEMTNQKKGHHEMMLHWTLTLNVVCIWVAIFRVTACLGRYCVPFTYKSQLAWHWSSSLCSIVAKTCSTRTIRRVSTRLKTWDWNWTHTRTCVFYRTIESIMAIASLFAFMWNNWSLESIILLTKSNNWSNNRSNFKPFSYYG